MSKSLEQLAEEVKQDFRPLVEFINKQVIVRETQNVYDDPIIGNFTKYVYRNYLPSLDIARVARNSLLEIIDDALEVNLSQISDLDFNVDSRDPRLIDMGIELVDGTKINVTLIDESATEEI